MGKKDNRRSRKMIQLKSQAKKKARIKRQIETAKAAKAGSTVTKKTTASAKPKAKTLA